MFIVLTAGVSLLVLQLVPFSAHADNAAPAKPVVATVEPAKPAAPAVKSVREIQIYNLRGMLN
jgi:hypothetical protein